MLEHESIQASSDETPAEEPHLARSAHCGCTCPDQTDGIESMPEEELLYDLAVNEIAEAIGASQSAVSHQLRILKQAHLVKFRRDGRSICYSLADGHVQTILDQGLSHICE